MAADSDSMMAGIQPEVEATFDALETHHNPELVHLVQGVRTFDFIPSEEATWNDTIASHDEGMMKIGGTEVVRRFLLPETATVTFFTN